MSLAVSRALIVALVPHRAWQPNWRQIRIQPPSSRSAPRLWRPTPGTDLLEKRRRVTQRWADAITPTGCRSARVVPFAIHLLHDCKFAETESCR